MKKLKIYLETTILNFYFADDSVEKCGDTEKLFEEINRGLYDTYTSYAVIREIDRASEPKRTKMLELISKYKISILEDTAEAEELSNIYINEKIIPEKYSQDALHIAIATFWNMDIVVSWNFKHIVKRKTIIMSNAINHREGYKNIDIHSPSEVIESD